VVNLPEVYADVLFLVNFFMNSLVLYITGRLLRKNPKLRRILAGSAFCSGLYCFILFTLGLSWFTVALTLVLLSFGVFIAFYPLTPKRFALTVAVAFGVTVTLGGAAFGLYYMLYSPYSNFGFGLPGGGFPLAILISSSAAIYILLRFIMKRLEKSHLHKQVFYNTYIWLNGLKTESTGMVDTGNCLVEPISRSPVVVAEAAALRPVLPQGINDLFRFGNENDIRRVVEEFNAGGLNTRIRLIPYKSASGGSGMFIGFKPDKIEIVKPRDNRIYEVTDAVVGICNFKLSPEGDFNTLLNPAIFQT
jgi:stage II sporulation protein GA (sporulation sigma-E factor processing peptidase)